MSTYIIDHEDDDATENVSTSDQTEAKRRLVLAWESFEDEPEGDERERAWRRVRSAFRIYRAHLSLDEINDRYSFAKAQVVEGTANRISRALAGYNAEKDRRLKATEAYREQERERDRCRARDDARRAVCRAANQRYRAKQRALRLAEKEAENG